MATRCMRALASRTRPGTPLMAPPTRSGRQRTGGACDGGVSGTGWRAGAAAGRGGGAEHLVKDVLLGRPQLGDLARHLLLTGGELVDALPHHGETERHRVELLPIGRRG